MRPIFEELLQRVSEAKPAGGPAPIGDVAELKVLIEGTTTEGPNRPAARKLAEGLLRKSKDLQVAILFCLAFVEAEKDRLLAFRESVDFIARFLKSYWDNLYPELDPADKTDTTKRRNHLSNLSLSPEGPNRFVRALREAPLTESASGSFCLADIQAAEKWAKNAAAGRPQAKAQPRSTSAQITSAIATTDQAILQTKHKLVVESLATLEEIGKFMGEPEHGGEQPDFVTLEDALGAIRDALAPYLGKPVPPEPIPPNPPGPNPPNPVVPTPGPMPTPSKNAINGPEDVEAMLKALQQYYKMTQPTHPMPYLLERALTWVRADFIVIDNDLSVQGVKPWLTGKK